MDAKKCDVCGEFYLSYNTQCDADDISDANRIYFVNENSQTYHRFDVCSCCMNKFLDLFYDIHKDYSEQTIVEIPKICKMCLNKDRLPNEDPCSSCVDRSNFVFKGCV